MGYAQDPSQMHQSGQAARDWTITMGGGVGYGPDYEGSNDYETSPFPAISLSYRNIVSIDGPGLRVNALGFFGAEDSGMMAGPLVRLATGREEKDNAALKGLGDIDTGVDAGVFLAYQLGPVALQISLTKEIADGHGGMQGELSLGYTQMFSDRLSGSVGASTAWADDTYMQKFFGVSGAQSAASGYGAYSAGAGFKSVGLSMGLNYQLSDRVSIAANAGYTRLIGDAADSPIVKVQGSADQLTAGLGLAYTF
jgi:MipA family protein